MSNKEIAREMNLGIGTVKVHMTALFTKLNVSTGPLRSLSGPRCYKSSELYAVLFLRAEKRQKREMPLRHPSQVP